MDNTFYVLPAHSPAPFPVHSSCALSHVLFMLLRIEKMSTLPELPEHIMVTAHLKALIFSPYPIIFPPRFQNQKQVREITYIKLKERGCVCASSAASPQIPSRGQLLNMIMARLCCPSSAALLHSQSFPPL